MVIYILLQFGSIYFRNATIFSIPAYLSFGDRTEVLFKMITKNASFTSGEFKIQIQNSDPKIDPVFRMEDCVIDGGDNLVSHPMKLELENQQKELDDDGEEECNYDYMGKLIFKRNKMGYLNTKVIDNYN